jgi:putative restriction endonuclease
MHDAAFDRGLVTFDQDHRLVLSPYLKDVESERSIKVNFTAFEGEKMRLPDKFAPDEAFLEYHREEVFVE